MDDTKVGLNDRIDAARKTGEERELAPDVTVPEYVEVARAEELAALGLRFMEASLKIHFFQMIGREDEEPCKTLNAERIKDAERMRELREGLGW